MTRSAESLRWAEYRASTNPVFPYEWAVRYADGSTFPRVQHGVARRAAEAPRAGIIGLRVTGPGGPFLVAARPGVPDEIVVRARVERLLADLSRGRVAHWRFGFRYGRTFDGILIDPLGRLAACPGGHRVEAPLSGRLRAGSVPPGAGADPMP